MQYQGPEVFEDMPLVRSGKYIFFSHYVFVLQHPESVNTEFKSQKLKMIFFFLQGITKNMIEDKRKSFK